MLQILRKYGEIENFNFVYHTIGPNVGQPKGFAFVKYKTVSGRNFQHPVLDLQMQFASFQAEDTIDVLAKLNNKKIGSKHIAIRYAKHIEVFDDGKSSKNVKIPALAAGSVSKASIADNKNKIQQIEEQLKNLQSRSNDFEINLNKNAAPSEPLIKKYQFNKDAPTTNSGRYQSYNKRRRKPY